MRIANHHTVQLQDRNNPYVARSRRPLRTVFVATSKSFDCGENVITKAHHVSNVEIAMPDEI